MSEKQLDIKAAWHCSQCRREGEAEVRALLASRALEEAKWWHERESTSPHDCKEEIAISQDGHYSFVIGCKRIAALEQAAASKAAEQERT